MRSFPFFIQRLKALNIIFLCLILDKEIDIQHYIMDQVYETRKKDYENPFRRATFRSEEEMIAAYGELEENSFIKLQREESRQCIERIQTIKKRLNN